MRGLTKVVPIVLAVTLVGGCASSTERTVWVPMTTSGHLASGDALGMQMMRQSGTVRTAWAPTQQPVAVTTLMPSADSEVVAAAQGGYVTMMSSYPGFALRRESNIRMPVATFAATDGPSAD
jgi:hypothetical protein